MRCHGNIPRSPRTPEDSPRYDSAGMNGEPYRLWLALGASRVGSDFQGADRQELTVGRVGDLRISDASISKLTLRLVWADDSWIAIRSGRNAIEFRDVLGRRDRLQRAGDLIQLRATRSKFAVYPKDAEPRSGWTPRVITAVVDVPAEPLDLRPGAIDGPTTHRVDAQPLPELTTLERDVLLAAARPVLESLDDEPELLAVTIADRVGLASAKRVTKQTELIVDKLVAWGWEGLQHSRDGEGSPAGMPRRRKTTNQLALIVDFALAHPSWLQPELVETLDQRSAARRGGETVASAHEG